MNSRNAAPGILTVNAGSSSIKFALFAADGSLRLKLRGAIDGIGGSGSMFSMQAPDQNERYSRPVTLHDHASAVTMLADWFEERDLAQSLVAIGHRIVHGGARYQAPQRLTAELVGELRRLIPLDPEHLPQEILLTETFGRRFPDLPQIACFDTAFHHDLPRVARILPIPRRFEAQGVRRYGFHGLSYEYLMTELARSAGPAAARGRIILAHLGNGASLAAVRDGKPIDTSMGLTPASGLPMGTRSGDLDPGLIGYLARASRMSAAQFDRMINFESGLLGVSEISADMRELLRIEGDDARAADAVRLFCYQVRKWIGGFAAALGGLDTLIFSGGIGENAAAIRTRICAGLGFLGIELDDARNLKHAALISTDAARATVRVIRTNEEWVIARAVGAILAAGLQQPQTEP